MILDQDGLADERLFQRGLVAGQRHVRPVKRLKQAHAAAGQLPQGLNGDGQVGRFVRGRDAFF